MGHTVIDLTTSTSGSLHDKNENNTDRRFQWDSIKKFMYFAFTFSSPSTNFDIFSKVLNKRDRFLEFIFFETTLGMTYMFMDVFIKQYTRKLDFNQCLNPLLRGVTAGLLLQTSVWTLIHASDLADAMRFLVTSLYQNPSWSNCPKVNTTCITPPDIMMICHLNIITKLSDTSAHVNYDKSFMTVDRASLTTRFFVVGVVWICNFFIVTIQNTSILKLFRLAFLGRMLSTLFIAVFMIFTNDYYASMAIFKIFDVTEYSSKPYTSSTDRFAHAFGIGFIGVYDFGTISPYTMVDNAIVLFVITFTALAFARSLIVQILHLALMNCVQIEISVTHHYLLFAVLPLSTEFMDAHKLYALYIYLDVTAAGSTYVAMLTLSISKLLHSEFRSVKNIYIIGILCFLGFGLSLPVAVLKTKVIKGLLFGLNLTALYLGGFKAAIVMWVYGVEKFCTDIHFWLGFRPTKFWRICWMFLPVLLFISVFNRIQKLIIMKDMQQKIIAVVWISVTMLTVFIFHIKTIAGYILRNNLAAAFRSSAKYGPPEPADRKKRRKFDVNLNYRQCKHNCLILDEKFDCNHLPLIFKKKQKLSPASSDSDTSLTKIYKSGRRRTSSVIEVSSQRD